MNPQKGSSDSIKSQAVAAKSSSQMRWDAACSLVCFKVISDVVCPSREHHAASRFSVALEASPQYCPPSSVVACPMSNCAWRPPVPPLAGPLELLQPLRRGEQILGRYCERYLPGHTQSCSMREHHLTRRCLRESAKFLFNRSTICSQGDYQPFTLSLLSTSHTWMGRSRNACL